MVEMGDKERCGGAVEVELNEATDKGETSGGWLTEDMLSFALCEGVAMCNEPCLSLVSDLGEFDRAFLVSSNVFVRGRRLVPVILLRLSFNVVASDESDRPSTPLAIDENALFLSFCLKTLLPGESGGGGNWLSEDW